MPRPSRTILYSTAHISISAKRVCPLCALSSRSTDSASHQLQGTPCLDETFTMPKAILSSPPLLAAPLPTFIAGGCPIPSLYRAPRPSSPDKDTRLTMR